jgi:hypothetical protein
MRVSRFVTGALLGLCLAAPARAQSLFSMTGPSLTVGGGQVVTPVASGIPIASPQQGFDFSSLRLTNFLPSFTGFKFTTAQPVIGTSQFPTAAQMPGLDYLRYFHYGRGVSIVP